jgi:hypothetical protein
MDFLDTPGDSSDDCGLNLLDRPPASTAETAFERDGQGLVEILGGFDGEDSAAEAFGAMEQALIDCIGGAEGNDVEFQERELDDIGVDSLLLSVVGAEGFPGTIEIVVARESNVLLYMAHAYLGDADESSTAALAERAYSTLSADHRIPASSQAPAQRHTIATTHSRLAALPQFTVHLDFNSKGR